MKLPSFNDLVPEQLFVYEYSPYESMLVVGPPGSGKTSMAIWRARVLISPEVNLKVALITRNRLLVAVAGQLAQEQNGAAISATTMHSFVSRDYYKNFQRKIPKVDDYDYAWDEILQDYHNAGILPTINHLIIDEGQNLPLPFFQWAVRFGAQKISVFADEHQTTMAGGTTVADLADVGFTTVFPLLVNHRNTIKIANLVGQFHLERIVPQASPKRGIGDTPYLFEISNWIELADTVAIRFKNRREAIGVIVYRVAEVQQMTSLLRERLAAFRVDSYTHLANSGAEFGIQMREVGVTVISSESAIGLEFDTLYLQDLSRSLPITSAIQHRRLYMLCARARDTLILVDGPRKLTATELNSLPSPPILER